MDIVASLNEDKLSLLGKREELVLRSNGENGMATATGCISQCGTCAPVSQAVRDQFFEFGASTHYFRDELWANIADLWGHNQESITSEHLDD
jgi:hypothetical protein